jgi:hypothetical protein
VRHLPGGSLAAMIWPPAGRSTICSSPSPIGRTSGSNPSARPASPYVAMKKKIPVIHFRGALHQAWLKSLEANPTSGRRDA